ncbi:hypothetical protein [Xanthobacter sp. 126]|uniref:hypothetical protein n=1 Tax=Xanthobacter sp. 126 TaxID=1131814 RepID=UPI0012DCEB7F|nr:hypothetical protein [Xanthobacter sp. 126]
MTGQWVPWHEAHSIEAVGVSVAFSESVNETLWRRMLRTAEEVAPAAGLTNVVSPSALHISFGGPNPVARNEEHRNLVHFQRIAVDIDGGNQALGNIAEELIVGRDSIQYISYQYSRWVPFLQQMTLFFGELLGKALVGVRPQNVRIEYRDRFVFDGEKSEALPSDLLRESSAYIASHAFSRKDLWHSHTGFFCDASGADRRLIQIMIDVADLLIADEAKRSIGILTVVQDNLGVGFLSEEVVDDPSAASQLVVSRFQELHDAAHSLFAQIVNDQTASRVGMDVGRRSSHA